MQPSRRSGLTSRSLVLSEILTETEPRTSVEPVGFPLHQRERLNPELYGVEEERRTMSVFINPPSSVIHREGLNS